jgi:hypothetical protein
MNMTLQAERLNRQAASVETSANPPPRNGADVFEGRLFQTMTELRATHIETANRRQRVLQLLFALLAGGVVFAALYALMLFVE